MAKKTLKSLFGKKPNTICLKGQDGLYYKAVKKQGRWIGVDPGYPDCATCKAATGATECKSFE